MYEVYDTAPNPPVTEDYTWNDDSTLASSPGDGFTNHYYWTEERQLISIYHDTTEAYAMAFGADGNRLWVKDIANNLWTWYACGVACGAGELIEETSDLTGQTWTTSALYLRAGAGCSSLLIRRNSGYHHFDPGTLRRADRLGRVQRPREGHSRRDHQRERNGDRQQPVRPVRRADVRDRERADAVEVDGPVRGCEWPGGGGGGG